MSSGSWCRPSKTANKWRSCFKRGQVDEFEIVAVRDLGQLTTVQIGHDSTGENDPQPCFESRGSGLSSRVCCRLMAASRVFPGLGSSKWLLEKIVVIPEQYPLPLTFRPDATQDPGG